MNRAKLLTIIVTYNGIKWIDKCLSSVLDASVKSDLFIVDNGSSDGTIEFIHKNYPSAHFIVSDQNLGFGKANNLGFEFAIANHYEYAYLLNQDAWVENDTYKNIIEVFEKHPRFGILSPLQVNKEKNKLDKNFLDYCCPPHLLSDAVCHNNRAMVYETNFVMAAHWMIPVSTIKEVGGFSPTFNMYGEDDNYIDRIKYWKYAVGIVPESVGVHDREHRKESPQKMVYIASMHWRDELSNPLFKIKDRNIKFLKSFYYSFIKYPWLSIKHLFFLLPDIRKINKNLKSSLLTGAFLTQSTIAEITQTK